MKRCLGLCTIVAMFLLAATAAGQNTAKVVGTIFIGSANATSATAKAYLMTSLEYGTFIECARNSTTAVPCLAKANPRFTSAVTERGFFRFDVPDGRKYHLVGLDVRTQRTTSIDVYVMGETEQDLFMR